MNIYKKQKIPQSTINALCRYLENIILPYDKSIFKNEYEIFCILEDMQNIALTNYVKTIFDNLLITPDNIDSVILYTIIILSRVKSKGLQFNSKTCHKLILIILMISSKIVEDEPYTNLSWANIGKISLENCNRMEFYIVKLLNYNLFVSHHNITSVTESLFFHNFSS